MMSVAVADRHTGAEAIAVPRNRATKAPACEKVMNQGTVTGTPDPEA